MTEKQKDAVKKISAIASKGGKLNSKKFRAILSSAGVQLPKAFETTTEVIENPAQVLIPLLMDALTKDGPPPKETS